MYIQIRILRILITRNINYTTAEIICHSVKSYFWIRWQTHVRNAFPSHVFGMPSLCKECPSFTVFGMPFLCKECPSFPVFGMPFLCKECPSFPVFGMPSLCKECLSCVWNTFPLWGIPFLPMCLECLPCVRNALPSLCLECLLFVRNAFPSLCLECLRIWKEWTSLIPCVWGSRE